MLHFRWHRPFFLDGLLKIFSGSIFIILVPRVAIRVVFREEAAAISSVVVMTSSSPSVRVHVTIRTIVVFRVQITMLVDCSVNWFGHFDSPSFLLNILFNLKMPQAYKKFPRFYVSLSTKLLRNHKQTVGKEPKIAVFICTKKLIKSKVNIVSWIHFSRIRHRYKQNFQIFNILFTDVKWSFFQWTFRNK